MRSKTLNESFKDYGEERWALRIAQFIVRERAIRPIDNHRRPCNGYQEGRTGWCAQRRRTSGAPRFSGDSNRSQRRTGCNNSLRTWGFCIEVIRDGGRLAVITFHSLEDRIVKQEFRRLARIRVNVRANFLYACAARHRLGKVVTRKPIVPSAKRKSDITGAQGAPN